MRSKPDLLPAKRVGNFMDTKPIQILLDTNCVNSKGRLLAITELEAMKAHGVVVHSSTATLDELPSGPGSMRQTAESRPVRSSTAIWGKSKWGGGDTWGSEEDGNLWEEIKAVLYGHKTTPTEQDAFDAKHILTAVQ